MDSVTEGVSLFMAELASIKAVMEAVQRATRASNGQLEMTFDYRIRGEAQSRNAVALMKHIGLRLEE